MNTTKILSTIAIIILLSLLFSACGGEQPQLNEDQEVSTIVAMTLAATTANPRASDADVLSEGDMQPLSAAECDTLASEMGQALGLTISSETVPVQMSWSGETGAACQLTGLGTGNNFESIFQPFEAVQSSLYGLGWAEEGMYIPCLGQGGAGPGADQSCYVNENKTCEIIVTLEPIDMKLCENVDGPIGECFNILTPEQKLFTTRLTCAQGKLSMPLRQTEAERIEFAAGAISAQVQDNLLIGLPRQYVLSAMQGQEMTINLVATGVVDFSVRGQDGTALLSDSAGATSWTGLLPSTQEYIIEVSSRDTGIVDFTLEVIIPPV